MALTRRSTTNLPVDEIVFISIIFISRGVQRWWHISSQRIDICISLVLEFVVGGEATLVYGNIRVASRPIDLVINSLAWAALTTSTCDMLRTDHSLASAKTSDSLCWRCLFRGDKAAAGKANICVSARAISVIDLGASCARKDTHFLFGQDVLELGYLW